MPLRSGSAFNLLIARFQKSERIAVGRLCGHCAVYKFKQLIELAAQRVSCFPMIGGNIQVIAASSDAGAVLTWREDPTLQPEGHMSDSIV